MKIAVDVSMINKAHKGVRLALPKIDTLYSLNSPTEANRGLQEFTRITKMEKIR
jgi:hypothetical protein